MTRPGDVLPCGDICTRDPDGAVSFGRVSVDLRQLPAALAAGWRLVETGANGVFVVERRLNMRGDPNLYRDGLLGWLGLLLVAGLVYLLIASGPSDREQRADRAVEQTLERAEIRAANERGQ